MKGASLCAYPITCFEEGYKGLSKSEYFLLFALYSSEK